MKQTYVSKASRINMKKYYDYLDKLLSDILPISVNFSNKSIIFNKEFHKIPFAEETLPRRQERLGRWF
jgi:hypothetical protein